MEAIGNSNRPIVFLFLDMPSHYKDYTRKFNDVEVNTVGVDEIVGVNGFSGGDLFKVSELVGRYTRAGKLQSIVQQAANATGLPTVREFQTLEICNAKGDRRMMFGAWPQDKYSGTEAYSAMINAKNLQEGFETVSGKLTVGVALAYPEPMCDFIFYSEESIVGNMKLKSEFSNEEYALVEDQEFEDVLFPYVPAGEPSLLLSCLLTRQKVHPRLLAIDNIIRQVKRSTKKPA